MMETFDFDTDIATKEEIEVDPQGWVPVTIEYGIKEYGAGSSWEMCWRVKTTTHVFRIPLHTFYDDCQGDYASHFKKVLEVFRTDYLDWYKSGFSEDWMKNYRNQFSKFIFTFE